MYLINVVRDAVSSRTTRASTEFDILTFGASSYRARRFSSGCMPALTPAGHLWPVTSINAVSGRFNEPQNTFYVQIFKFLSAILSVWMPNLLPFDIG